ncbi:uncharacterized protein H6S33_007630 [Morchella sextelata]|uniref:uncharacterized protein n=1 Tax=Morchella sextelata TaxID=1174677 RepID=UPI001D03B565|nr:uncharacterized protein H6S33_007630 [Morchella sextelata]KAH0603308.1 hypothetical protein H6S33_007630 [Morchella sextelata]
MNTAGEERSPTTNFLPARPNLLEYQLSLESHVVESRATDVTRTCSCMEKIFIGALVSDEKIVLEGCSPTIDFCYFHNSPTNRPNMLVPCSDTSVAEGAVKYIIGEGGRLALNCNRGGKWCRVLHWAIESENTRLVFMAIGHESVDINQRDWFNRTPLHLGNSKRSPALTKLLLNAGANVNAIDDHNAKPLHYAISRWKSELKKKNSRQLNDSMKVLNQNLEAALTSKEEYFMEGVPLLHFAVEYRHLGVIETLLATRKGDVNVRDSRGRTALFVAFKHKLLDMVDLLIMKYGANEGLKEETGQKYNYVAEKDYHYQCDLENLRRRVSNIPYVERSGHHGIMLGRGRISQNTASTSSRIPDIPEILQSRLRSMKKEVSNSWWEEEEEEEEEEEKGEGFSWDDWNGENAEF